MLTRAYDSMLIRANGSKLTGLKSKSKVKYCT